MAIVLCIDEHETVLEILQRLFESTGHRVLIAPSAEMGLSLIRRNYPIEAVVVNFNVAPISGHSFAELMMTEKPNLPVVLWNGCPQERSRSVDWFLDPTFLKGGPLPALLAVVELSMRNANAGKKHDIQDAYYVA